MYLYGVYSSISNINFVTRIKIGVLFFVIRFLMSAISAMLYGAIRKI